MFLPDGTTFQQMNGEYRKYFLEPSGPCRCRGAAAEALVEMTFIASSSARGIEAGCQSGANLSTAIVAGQRVYRRASSAIGPTMPAIRGPDDGDTDEDSSRAQAGSVPRMSSTASSTCPTWRRTGDERAPERSSETSGACDGRIRLFAPDGLVGS